MSSPPRSASLFVTCVVDTLFPETGIAVVVLLERLGLALVHLRHQSAQEGPAAPVMRTSYPSAANLTPVLMRRVRASPIRIAQPMGFDQYHLKGTWR